MRVRCRDDVGSCSLHAHSRTRTHRRRVGFRPETLSHATLGNPLDGPFKHMTEREDKGMRTGEFGLLMTRSLVDEFIYNEAHNEVVFVKYLD